jgi:hypothetical protein
MTRFRNAEYVRDTVMDDLHQGKYEARLIDKYGPAGKEEIGPAA